MGERVERREGGHLTGDAALAGWKLPGDDPQPYAVYVDERDLVWLTDFGANAVVRFDPFTERFDTFKLGTRPPRACVS